MAQGHDPDWRASAGADLCRREQARRRHVARSPKRCENGLEPARDMTGDILEEDLFRTAFPTKPATSGQR